MADQLTLFTTPQTGTTSDDYYTPKWVFDALGVTFDLDVAAPPGGPPFVPCQRYYTQADDGLASPWEGLVWMNPPYSKAAPWVDKFLRHGNGIALVPFSKAMWHQALWNSDTTALHLGMNPNGRLLTFETSQGRPQGIFMPVCLWAAGDQAKNILHNSNLGKVR